MTIYELREAIEDARKIQGSKDHWKFQQTNALLSAIDKTEQFLNELEEGLNDEKTRG